MATLEWSPTGVGLTSVFFTFLLLGIFNKRIFGYLDPLSIYLSTRAAPTLAAITLLFSTNAISSYFYILAAASVFLFITALYFTTPKIITNNFILDERHINDLFKIALALSTFKFGILFTATGSLPIFGDSGSDSFIGFAENNKVATSFLLAIGSSELVLLSLLTFVTKGRYRLIVVIFLLLSILMHLSGGKKSALLAILFALALGEYLRIGFTNYKKRRFTNIKFVSVLFVAALLWASYLFQETSGGIIVSENNLISGLLDLIFVQWAYPTFLFSSGDLVDFFDNYYVNKLIYFFHSALSPLGFPAFTASIGPALHEYQTGQLTGNGINPTYVLEGYVIFGVFLPVYAFLSALIIGKFRGQIAMIKNPRNKILLYALLLPAIYIFPIDALLFMKILIALFLLSPSLLFLIRAVKI